MSRGARRAAFWLTVAGVSILSNLGLEVLAHHSTSPGLKRFAALTHLGAASGSK
jgi:ribosomal protein L32